MNTKTVFKQSKINMRQAFISPINGAAHEVNEINEFLTIGRDPENLYVIPDLTVSGRHARIEFRNGIYLLKDLRSSNGTFLNGSKICEAPLNQNDRIQFGCKEYLFSFNRDKRPESLKLSSKNAKWNFQLQTIPDMSQSDLPVLITGPSGSGKEVLSQLIHNCSPQKMGPLVTVNCSALSESLVESELFGHSKGSFTDATNDRKGAFESARGGTLFLDEIGDLPLSLQPKLLRALENKEIRPVGSDKTVKTQVRIITATHHNLKDKVLNGTFRADLFFRLNVLSIQSPGLIERMEDFEDLLYLFAREYHVGIDSEALIELKKHHWPGNIRELKTVIARAKARGITKIMASDLSFLLDDLPENFGLNYNQQNFNNFDLFHNSTDNIFKTIEKNIIERRLRSNFGNQRQTAKDLGIPKSTLHDRIKNYKINVTQMTNKVKK